MDDIFDNTGGIGWFSMVLFKVKMFKIYWTFNFKDGHVVSMGFCSVPRFEVPP